MSLLWTPDPSPALPRAIDTFRAHVEAKYSVALPDYAALHRWTVDNPAEFWGSVYADVAPAVQASAPYTQVLDTTVPMDQIPASWFVGARLNWAENQLRCRSATHTALIEVPEPVTGQPLVYARTSYADLHYRVYLVTLAFKELGLRPGQVVGFYGPTSEASVVLLLAVTAVGAIWSSAASDFGSQGVLERFSQLNGDLWGVVGVKSIRYGGKTLPQLAKLREVVAGLRTARTTKLHVIVHDYLQEGGLEGELQGDEMAYAALLSLGEAEARTLGVVEGQESIDFYQAPFDYPLWVLFSSGTTGSPKPLTHGAGRMLLQSKKEHVLHGGMTDRDVFFYYTTPGWMMFNYLVSGLATGATLVLFDGSPLHRPELLWQMAEDLKVTVFGTSAKYIDVLSKNYIPKDHHDLSHLTQVLSTGSPLKAELFVWVYENVSKNIVLGSITGGTDICSLFAAHNVSLPVYAGEIQCLGLGMAVESWSEDGQRLDQTVAGAEAGELVCVKPFVAMPVFLWGDVGHKRYRESYFDKFPGVWAHGDYCVVTPSRGGSGGGLDMRGRSDGVLNPSGIRFGSSEIYEVLDTFSPTSVESHTVGLEQYGVIEDSLVIGQKLLDGADERVVLFVKLVGEAMLDDALLAEIKKRIRTRRSARHVPARILAVRGIPFTVNGKKVEIPVKKLLNGDKGIAGINLTTLMNPECLPEYVELARSLKAELVV